MRANISNAMNNAKTIGFTIGKFYKDEEFKKMFGEGLSTFESVSYVLDKYPDDCINLICAYDGITEEEYNPENGRALFTDMLRVITAKEIAQVFQSAV